jgi:hypothetical protein
MHVGGPMGCTQPTTLGYWDKIKEKGCLCNYMYLAYENKIHSFIVSIFYAQIEKKIIIIAAITLFVCFKILQEK